MTLHYAVYVNGTLHDSTTDLPARDRMIASASVRGVVSLTITEVK